MPVDEFIKRKMGQELTEHLVFQVRAMMLRGAERYIKSSDIKSLKNGIKAPHQLRARINEGIRVYGQQRIVDAFLSAGGSMTIAEFNEDLQGLEDYAQELVDRRAGGEDWGTIAAGIEANVVDKVAEWNFPLPSGYLDVWGE